MKSLLDFDYTNIVGTDWSELEKACQEIKKLSDEDWREIVRKNSLKMSEAVKKYGPRFAKHIRELKDKKGNNDD